MIISEADLRLMLDINSGEIVDENGKTKLTVLPIGTSVIFPEYQVKVKLNEFLDSTLRFLGIQEPASQTQSQD